MDDETTNAIRNISPRKFFLAGGKQKITGLAAKWWWLPSFLARMLVGFVFIRAGWNQLCLLNPERGALIHFWNPTSTGHRWDVFFPVLELVCGALMALGLFTRYAALLLLGLLATSLLDVQLRELTGLNLLALQNFAVIALLVGLCSSGGGSGSLDRCLFKRNPPVAE